MRYINNNMMLWFIVSVFLVIVCIVEFILLLYDKGIFSGYINSAMEMIHREGIRNTFRRSCSIIEGKLLDNIPKIMRKGRMSPDDRISIAFYPTGGLGDYIVSAAILEELQSISQCYIDVYVENLMFGNAIYEQREGVSVEEYRYFEKRRNTYDLALMIEHFIHVKNCNKKRLMALSPELYRKIQYIKSNWNDLYIDIHKQCWRERILFDRCKLLGLDRWTELRMGEAFAVRTKKVMIPLNEKYKEMWKSVLADDEPYITINCGAGIIKRDGTQLKTWSEKSWNEFVRKMKREFPSIHVVQIGAKNDKKIEGIDQSFLGQDLELIKWILKNSKAHIDCEGGLVHLATQLGTKCIVLFGPTPIHMYAYNQNINLLGQECGNCMGLHENWAYECIYKTKQICMESIKVENVLAACKSILERNIIDETAKKVDC